MDWGLVIPNNHAMTDEDCEYMIDTIGGFVAERGLA